MVAAKSSRVNCQYKTKYRIRNWREYERGLRSRGDVTIWLSEDAIAAWVAPKNGLRGGQRRYSNLAVRTALTLRVVFSLPLRQTEGFLDSLLRLMGLNLKAPDHTTLSRRNQIVAVPPLTRSYDGPIDLIVDSTGLKILGCGEWNAHKHKASKKRRDWRKLHIGVDAEGFIVAAELTASSRDDASTLPALLDTIEVPIRHFTADGAYDHRSVYDQLRTLEPLRGSLNAALKKTWKEWEIPREADAKWPSAAKKLHADLWQARIARQKEIDASIAAKADYEYLYDKPYENKKVVRVAGPFTVESLSPHRVLGVGEDDELIDIRKEDSTAYGAKQSFPQMILENLKTAGVQQAHKGDRIAFTALTPWPGELVCAEGRYLEGEAEKRAAIFIGPEFGTVQRADLVAGAREAGDAGFDVLIACAFNYEAHAAEFSKLGRIPVLKARMNADLHMAEDLKNTGKGNLFVIFGEPDIDLLPEPDDRLRVKVKGVDVFDPSTGEVRSDGADGIACWFIDTDYNEESFFVRHAYFLGANDPYKALKTTLKTEINQEAWETLHSDTSRPFEKPKSGRIAVKVINHLGDEVMKVFRV